MRLLPRAALLSLLLPASLLPSSFAVAGPESGAAVKQLGEALRSDQVEALRLTWVSGLPSASGFRRLRIEGGKATLESCSSDCKGLGEAEALSPGERAQLLSRLRSAQLGSLRDSDSDVASDRQLEVAVGTTLLGQWRLARAEWPTSADGYGVADYLDDLGRRIEQKSAARSLLPIPHTVAELRPLRLQLRVRPRSRPGGLVVVEQGELRVQPEEGTIAQTPRLRPFSRPLSVEEQERLLSGLQAARLDDLESAIPKRGQPAIGDDDGRLVALHLLGSDAASADERARLASHQPRGYERYLADLLRGAPSPLVQQLLGYLVTESAAQKAAPPPGPSGRAAARRGR